MVMLGLLDVMPLSERVRAGTSADGQDVFYDITGLSSEDIWKLLTKYPNLFSVLANAGSNPAGVNPEIIADIIAAATRSLGNQEATERARVLPIAVQMKILQAMGRVTFPDGFGPFLEDLKSMSSSVRASVEVVIRDQATTLPPQPKSSEPPEIQPSGN